MLRDEKVISDPNKYRFRLSLHSMKIIENRKCLVLSWDRDHRVFGLKVKRGKRGRIVVLDFASSLDGGERNETPSEGIGDGQPSSAVLARRIADVYRRLTPGEQFSVVLSGPLPQCAVLDLRMAKLPVNDLIHALPFEMPRHIPIDPSNLVTGFRIIRQDANSLIVRVFCVNRQAWDSFTTEIAAAGVKADAMIHPFLSCDPVWSRCDSIYLPTIHPEFAFRMNPEEHIRRAVTVLPDESTAICPKLDETMLELKFDRDAAVEGELGESFIPCLVSTAYACGSEILKDCQTLHVLPKRLQPERFRGLRTVMILLLLVVTCLLLLFLGRLWSETRERYVRIRSEIDAVNRKIVEIQNENRKLLMTGDFANQIFEADLGSDEILYALMEITKTLPKGIWVTNLSARGFKIDLTLKAESGVDDNTAFLKTMKLFDVQNVNKRSGTDGVNIFVTLVYKNPRNVKRTEDDG